jgi:hypothetical protein
MQVEPLQQPNGQVVEPHVGASGSGASIDAPSTLASMAALASTAVLPSTAALASTGAASVSTALIVFDEQARDMKNRASSAAVGSIRTIGFLLYRATRCGPASGTPTASSPSSVALDPLR